MSFKEHLLKKVVPTYFMVVTFLNIGMLIAGQIFFEEAQFGYDVFFSPLFFGLIGCIPTLLNFLFQKKKADHGAIIMQLLSELVILEVCILGAAKLIGVIDSVLTAVIISCMVLVIFVVTGTLQYLQDQALCSKMNKALLQHKSQNQDDSE